MKENVFTAWCWLYIGFLSLYFFSWVLYPTAEEDSKGQCPLHWGQLLPFTVIQRTVVGYWMWELKACNFKAVLHCLTVLQMIRSQVLYYSGFMFGKKYLQCWYNITNGSDKENDPTFWIWQIHDSWSACGVSFKPLHTMYAGLLISFK